MKMQLFPSKSSSRLWLQNNRRSWRIAFLLLLALSIIGPWTFDRIYVPPAYTCSAPNMRLNDQFCGTPLSITWVFPYFFGEIIYLVTGLGTETLGMDDATRQILFMASIGLILLPLLTTFLVIPRGDHQRGYVLHCVVLGLGAGMGGFIGFLNFSRASWVLWGVWLYVLAALGLLILEIFAAKPYDFRKMVLPRLVGS